MGKDSIPLVPFANVHKTFGANGELIIKLFPETPEEIPLSEPVFIFIDEYPVPFFFKSFDTRGNNRALVIFDDMETMILAEELVGHTIYSKQLKNKNRQSTSDNRQLIGYSIEDTIAGNLGTVADFMDIPGNPCLLAINGNNEIMIPFHDEFIVKINHKKQIINTSLPEGLITLNQDA